jgi:ornithine--oxo-acid transaminase
MSLTDTHIEQAEKFSAHNYAPLPVVIERGEAATVWDVEGKEYLDMVGAYSALNQGHRHPRIMAALAEQAGKLTLTSRAFHNDRMGSFLEKLCKLLDYPKALPMNTGAEAVETAIKTVRKWGYKVKGVPDGKAEIIVCENNFHGRTVTIVSFSTEPQYQDGFGPFTPGFKVVPYGDLAALEAAITEHTVGFLVEPIQGEGGVVVPPAGYLEGAAKLCKERNVLLMADEIQTGLGRTGRMLACDHEGVHPDVLILGKALGGGVYPVSAVLAGDAAMGVYHPGDHGSTFGGNPLAAAVGIASLDVLVDEKLPQRAAELGEWMMGEIRRLGSPHITQVRGKGLLIGIVIKKESGTAKEFAKKLKPLGLLSKDTDMQVLRLAPPLVIEKAQLEKALAAIKQVFC